MVYERCGLRGKFGKFCCNLREHIVISWGLFQDINFL